MWGLATLGSVQNLREEVDTIIAEYLEALDDSEAVRALRYACGLARL